MTPPGNLNDLRARLHHTGVTIRINHRAEVLRTRWPDTIDPNTQADLITTLRAAKPALLDAAAGRCAWCSSTPRWVYDADTGWPICQPCAREVGEARLRVEHPELFTVEPEQGAA